jgi:hypothetical protein
VLAIHEVSHAWTKREKAREPISQIGLWEGLWLGELGVP